MVRHTASPPPDVSVIVCHHTGDLLQRCLKSLLTSEGITWECLIITSALITLAPNDLRFRILYEPGGPAHKRNYGVMHARAETFVFLDDDVEVAPSTLYQLWYELQHRPHAGMGFAKILKMDDRQTFDDAGSWLTASGFLWARAGNGQVDAGQYDEPVRCLASKSATCGVRRAAFRAAGGFDASYFILGEETDLAWRMWLQGWEVWYWPLALSYHAFDTPLKPKALYYTLQRIHEYGARNYVNLLLTNLGLWRLVGILPVHLCIWHLAALGFWWKGDGSRAALILRGIWSHLQAKTWQRTMTKRRQVQQTRRRTDRELWTCIAASPPWAYYLQRLGRYVTQGLHG